MVCQNQFFQPTWLPLSPDDLAHRNQHPSLEGIQRLLWVTFCLFNTGDIQSNRIESVYRRVKTLIPDRGLKKLKHYNNRLSVCFASSPAELITKKPPPLSRLPFSPRIGYKNLRRLVSPKLAQVTVIKEVKHS